MVSYPCSISWWWLGRRVVSDKYRASRFQPQVDPDNYASVAAALKADRERSRVCGPGYEEIYAPTAGGPRPRAQKCCYNQNTETLVIVMTNPGSGGRASYSWIQYDGVDSESWEELKMMDSTNEFVTQVLSGYPWLDTSYGQLPRTRGETFELGFGEYL
jgi:hypothetical protein